MKDCNARQWPSPAGNVAFRNLPQAAYIELGNLAGDPECWYFWGRAGLHSEDLMRVMPALQRRLRASIATNTLEGIRAGSGGKARKQSTASELVVLPILKLAAASHGERGDAAPFLQAAPIESTIAAPKDWCPNPEHTSCLRVKGHSMTPSD